MRYLLAILFVGIGCAAEITHGPILGRLSATEIGVWARTARPGEFQVRYGERQGAPSGRVRQAAPLHGSGEQPYEDVPGENPWELDRISEPVRTELEHDNTGWVLIEGLKPNTKYYYRVMGDPGERSLPELGGSFRTLPDSKSLHHSTHNPKGLFNFNFEYACGNSQPRDPSLPAFRTMLDQIEDKIHFAILDGDWLYEEKREYTPEEWRRQVAATRTPRVVELAPTIVGVWENYKLYLSRGKNLAEWHREVPSFFMFDDHEMLNDVNGTGTPGLRSRRAAFRDIGLQAWNDYLGWADPIGWKQNIHFGKAKLEAGSDVLVDDAADFRELKLHEAGTLTVHWGTPDAGVNNVRLDSIGGDPNAGVYEIREVLDRNRLRIHPAPPASGTQSYSVGRFWHFRKRVANAEFFYIDTRSHRQMHDIKDPFKEDVSILGAPQKAWLKASMRDSDADFLFVVSSVNLMVPHVRFGEEKGNKDEAWTSVASEREELINFWDSIGKPVFVLTGDLHNSFAIKITDRVWEFASGPHNSNNHRLAEESDRPTNGPFESRGRQCEIRWSSFVPNEIGGRVSRPLYCVVGIKNVFRIPGKGVEPDVWAAYDKPQVVFQYYDGLNGELLYAESILAN